MPDTQLKSRFCLSVVGWLFFFFKQKTAYELRISYWSSDVCSSDLDKALRKQRNANRRFVGWIIRLATGREGDSPVERRLRALCNQIDVEQDRSAMRAATANHLILALDYKVQDRKSTRLNSSH